MTYLEIGKEWDSSRPMVSRSLACEIPLCLLTTYINSLILKYFQKLKTTKKRTKDYKTYKLYLCNMYHEKDFIYKTF